MRRIALLMLVWLAGSGYGQSVPYVVETTTDGVLRSGPGDTMPDTGQVIRGSRLVVVHEDGDWLAVLPPQGQVSWINHKFLAPKDDQPGDVIPRNAVVYAEPDTEIAVGRPGLSRPLDVRKTRIPDGTIVCIIGPKVDVNGSMWYPIAPPDGDYRYLSRSAVRPVRGSPGTGFVVRSPTPPPVVPTSGTMDTPPVASLNASGTTISPRGENWPNHPLWRQAEQAERDGDYARAEQLYLRLAAEMNRPGGDPDLANLCYNRVHAVREKLRGSQRTGVTTTRNDLPPAASGVARTGEVGWSRPGRLREAGFRFDRQPTFALIDDDGKIICYAIANQRLDLSRYVGRDLELYGEVEYPSELRRSLMVVSSVRAAR